MFKDQQCVFLNFKNVNNVQVENDLISLFRKNISVKRYFVIVIFGVYDICKLKFKKNRKKIILDFLCLMKQDFDSGCNLTVFESDKRE